MQQLTCFSAKWPISLTMRPMVGDSIMTQTVRLEPATTHRARSPGREPMHSVNQAIVRLHQTPAKISLAYSFRCETTYSVRRGIIRPRRAHTLCPGASVLVKPCMSTRPASPVGTSFQGSNNKSKSKPSGVNLLHRWDILRCAQ